MNSNQMILGASIISLIAVGTPQAHAGSSLNGTKLNSSTHNGESFNGASYNGNGYNGASVAKTAAFGGSLLDRADEEDQASNELVAGSSLMSMAEGSLFAASPCSESANPTTTVFADSGFVRFDGNGSYSFPYGTIESALNHLEENIEVSTVCLTGTFPEAIELGWSIEQNELYFYGYKGGATIDSREKSYAVSNSASLGSFHRLVFVNLSVQGNGYAAFSLNNVDEVDLAWLTIDSQRFSYGLKLRDNQEVEIAGVEILCGDDTYAAISLSSNDDVNLREVTIDAWGASYGVVQNHGRTLFADDLSVENSGYAAISVQGTNSVEISNSRLSNTGSYGIMADSEAIMISSSRLEGYSYSGMNLEGDTVVVEKCKFFGDGAYNGISLDSNDYALISNNFLLNHETAGANVGDSSGDVNILNNSFRNNQYAVRTNNSEPHELAVTSFNNIFYSRTDQCAYDRTHLMGNLTGSGMLFDGTLLSEPAESEEYSSYHQAIDTLNRRLRLISDYNLFYGCVIKQTEGKAYFSEWQSELGYGEHSLEGNPRFTSTRNLHILSDSAARNAGMDLGSYFSEDIDREDRDSTPDIGADEIPSADYVHTMQAFAWLNEL